jgi:hypothetical protein
MTTSTPTQLTAELAALNTLVNKFQWTVWATHERRSGHAKHGAELIAIVEVRKGKLIKISNDGYSDYFMVEEESRGWSNLGLLPEVRNFGKAFYQLVGSGWSERIDSIEELASRCQITGTQDNRHLTKELIGQPILAGFAGPMYNGHEDGKPVIRYETGQAKRGLSL